MQTDIFPQTTTIQYDRWPSELDRYEEMQFRLIYEGQLPAASTSSTRRDEKHAIRKVVHRQLLELWKNHPFLKRFVEGVTMPIAGGDPRTVMSAMADNFARCGYRFLPLISNARGIACSLEILFLRRDHPGDLIKSGGDIDNRIKVLFDALRIPQQCNEVQGFSPAPDEDPFLCLLEDDSLITELTVTTDRLLTPSAGGHSVNDVHLIINVKTVLLNADNTWDVFKY